MATLSDGSILDRHEKLRLAEERRQQLIQDRFDAAHERAMRTRSAFAESSPNSVSPQHYAAMMKWRHDNGLTGRERAIQDFERGMARDRIKGDVAVAHEKRMGMENQGLGVGRLKHGYTDENGNYHEGSEERIARHQGETALTLEEKKLAGQKDLASIGLQQHELEWGNGGGRERVAEIEGKSKVGAAEAQARAAADLQAQKNALEEQKRVAAAEKEKGRLKLQYDKLAQKDRASVDTAANSLAREKGIGFEDARTQVMASREQAQQGGNIATDSTGKKWEIVRDANGKPIGKRPVQ